MNFDTAVSHINSQLVEFSLAKALNGDMRDINFDFIEPFIVFMSQQLQATPFGAVIGALAGSNQSRIHSAMLFLEALVEHNIIRVKCVNGNWLVNPLNVQHEINKHLGCDTRPIKVGKVFCGKTLHKPKATRTDHLELLNSIKFELNSDFITQFPNIPENVAFLKTLPELLETKGTIYEEHRYDTRGRTYCASHINYQGTEYEKCLLKFSKETILTDEGRDNIREYVKTLKDDETYLKFVANSALNSKSTGIFIGADASASGIQLMSVLRGCDISAESVGLIANSDFYSLAKSTANLQVQPGQDPRKVFKECCMQHFYGGVKTPRARLGEENLPKFYETLEKLAPGCQRLLEELQLIYHPTDVFTWTLPDDFLVQQPVVETQTVELSMPNNPHVTFGYNYKSLVKRQKGLEMAANVVHSVDGYVARELIYRAKEGCSLINNEFYVDKLNKAIKQAGSYDKVGKVFSLHKLMNTPTDKWSLLGKSFLQKALNYLQAAQARGMVSFDVISIHDDFKCHPNYLNDVKWLYMEILAEIANSTLIKDIIEEINPAVEYNKVPNDFLASKLRTAHVQGTGQGLT